MMKYVSVKQIDFRVDENLEILTEDVDTGEGKRVGTLFA